MDKQTEREYREALGGLRFSQETKESMMKSLMEQKGQKPAKRRGVRPLRTGLIAAAVCAALALTAGAAAYQMIVQIHSDREIDGQHYAGFSVYGSFTEFPLSDFSPELIAACEGNRDPFNIVQPGFATREAAWNFLGRDIPCVWAKGDDVWFRDGDNMSKLSTDYEYRVVLWQNYETRRLDGVDVYYYLDSVSGMNAMVTMKVFAETLEPPEDWDGTISGMLEYQDRQVERLENYSMPNGATAEVVIIDGTEDGPMTDCYGCFLYEGIFYQVVVHGRLDTPKEELTAQLCAVLDSFE